MAWAREEDSLYLLINVQAAYSNCFWVLRCCPNCSCNIFEFLPNLVQCKASCKQLSRISSLQLCWEIVQQTMRLIIIRHTVTVSSRATRDLFQSFCIVGNTSNDRELYPFYREAKHVAPKRAVVLQSVLFQLSKPDSSYSTLLQYPTSQLVLS